MRRVFSRTMTSIAALAVMGCGAAYAQQAPSATEATKDVADEVQIEEVIVTATKRETNLQSTPISMAVMGTEELKKRHIESLYNLADGSIPSLRIATFEARQSALTIGIRGIVPLDANQPAREQGVGIYIDGVYLGRQHGLNAALFDVERIEVLKGPQGTLFGRNTEGGALSIVTRAPTGEFGGRVSADFGNYGSYTGQAHVNLPEWNGLSLKLDVVTQHQDAVTENPLPGAEGWGMYDRTGGRISARWQIADNIRSDFSYDYVHDKNTPFYSQLLNLNPRNCVNGPIANSPNCTLPGVNFTTLTGGPVKPLMPGVVVEGEKRMKVADIGVPQEPSVDKTFGFTHNLKWNINDELEFRSITSWRGVDVDQWDNAGGAHRVPIVSPGCTGTACNFSRYSLATLYQRQFSQEFQGVGTIGDFDYIIGAFYFEEHVADDAATPNSNAITGYTTAGQTSGYNFVVVNSCTGSGGFGWDKGCRSIDRASEVWSKSYALFGQVTWNPTETLHITGGVRSTHDDKRGILKKFRNVDYRLPANAAIVAANGYTPLDKTWDRINPMLTVAWEPTDGINLYAKYATGYRSGGASSRTANYQAFDPEDLKSYEVGMKSDFWERRARLNIAAYMMDREDSQIDISFIQPAAGSNVNVLRTINAAGTTKIQGIEADLTLRPIDGLTLGFSYAYTDTEIPLVPVTFTVAGVTSAPVLQRFYIPFTPKNAASASIDYEMPVGSENAELRFHIDANYGQATQAFDQFETKADQSFLVNARISIANIGVGDRKDLTLALWARNLFDEEHVFRRDPSNSLPGAPTSSLTAGSIANVLGDYGNFNAPRTFGLEATVNF